MINDFIGFWVPCLEASLVFANRHGWQTPIASSTPRTLSRRAATAAQVVLLEAAPLDGVGRDLAITAT
jgi:hypothetical protein